MHAEAHLLVETSYGGLLVGCALRQHGCNESCWHLARHLSPLLHGRTF